MGRPKKKKCQDQFLRRHHAPSPRRNLGSSINVPHQQPAELSASTVDSFSSDTEATNQAARMVVNLGISSIRRPLQNRSINPFHMLMGQLRSCHLTNAHAFQSFI
ncbi:hypothetical protein CLAIMM_10387 isoform 1 [Cladophialophora immunda]|nr:hypothetical protein CLAIMM_10387 isoform 1 [Cladophialophora immunda]